MQKYQKNSGTFSYSKSFKLTNFYRCIDKVRKLSLEEKLNIHTCKRMNFLVEMIEKVFKT
jgi:hypothetical protein